MTLETPGAPVATHARWLVFALPVLCAAIQLVPAAQSALELDRGLIARGQVWRLVTGNLVHFGWRHFASDTATLTVLLVLGFHVWKRTALAAALALPAVGFAVYVFEPGILTYRGSSGIVYALFTVVLIDLFENRRAAGRLFPLVVLGFLVAKSVFEMATGRALLGVMLPDGVRVLGVAHIAGMVAGAAAAGRFRRA